MRVAPPLMAFFLEYAVYDTEIVKAHVTQARRLKHKVFKKDPCFLRKLEIDAAFKVEEYRNQNIEQAELHGR